MKLHHLKGRKTSDYLLRKGKVWKGKTMTAYWLPGTPPVPKGKKGSAMRPGLYVGTFASVKLHKSAVVRNRMRRRIREALRTFLQKQTEAPSAQLLLTPRSASLKAPFRDIETDVSVFLSLLPWPQKKPLPASGISS